MGNVRVDRDGAALRCADRPLRVGQRRRVTLRRCVVKRALVLMVLVVACSSSAETERCAHCGMVVDAESGWRAGATSGGETLRFDTPKCLFAYREQHTAIRDPWVIEYYAQERRDADALFYVLGSDVHG